MARLDHFILSILLAIIYSLLTLIAAIQIARIIYYRHKKLSFQFIFLVIVFVWTCIRATFFGQTTQWPGWVVLTFYLMPINLQFMTLSLLVVFYAWLLYNQSHQRYVWSQNKWKFFVVWALANSSVFVLTLVQIILGCSNGTCQVTASFENFHHLYMALAFLLLVVAYAYYAVLFARTQQTHLALLGESWSSPSAGWSFSLLTFFLWLVLLSRCFYNFAVAVGWNAMSIDIGGNDGGVKLIGWIAFLMFVVWEVVPTTTVLIYFRSIPATRLGCWEQLVRYFCPSGETSSLISRTASPSSAPSTSGASSSPPSPESAEPASAAVTVIKKNQPRITVYQSLPSNSNPSSHPHSHSALSASPEAHPSSQPNHNHLNYHHHSHSLPVPNSTTTTAISTSPALLHSNPLHSPSSVFVSPSSHSAMTAVVDLPAATDFVSVSPHPLSPPSAHFLPTPPRRTSATLGSGVMVAQPAHASSGPSQVVVQNRYFEDMEDEEVGGLGEYCDPARWDKTTLG